MPARLSIFIIVLAVALSTLSFSATQVWAQRDIEQLSTIELYRHSLESLIGEKKRQLITNTPAGKLFWNALTSNEQWLHDLLDSGPISNPQLVVERLQFIWTKDQDLQKDRHSRTMATAVALEYGRRNWSSNAAWNRYVFYRDSLNEKRLHQVYESLETWEKRYLAGHALNFHGEASSQRWLRDNVKLPIRGYQSVCWRIPYRSYNCLGDSVQGSFYYAPFRASFDTFSQMTIYVGGVCGRLSGFGAGAAVANGIPASTMGEPGHCAYTIRISRGNWVPCYSLNWRRGLHTSMYSNKFSELVLFDKIFEDKKRLQESQRLRFQARQLQKKSPQRSIELYQAALRAHPIHVEVWSEYANFLRSSNSTTKQWQSYHQALIQLMIDYPETLSRLLQQQVYPNLLGKLSPEEKVVLFGGFHRKLKSWGPSRWDFEAFLNWQFKAIGNHPELKNRFVNAVAISHANSTAYGGPAITWVVSKVQGDPKKLEEILTAVVDHFSKEGFRDATRKNISRLAGRLMKDSKSRNDLECFYRVGELLEKSFGPYPKLKNPPFPGELVTQGAIVRYSGLTEKYDTGDGHYWLGSSREGFIFANWGKNVWISLEFKELATLNGIQLNRKVHRRNRDLPIAIDVSEDGQNWREVHVVRDKRDVNNIDLRGRQIEARFIRLRHLGKNSLQLKNIRVFGEN